MLAFRLFARREMRSTRETSPSSPGIRQRMNTRCISRLSALPEIRVPSLMVPGCSPSADPTATAGFSCFPLQSANSRDCARSTLVAACMSAVRHLLQGLKYIEDAAFDATPVHQIKCHGTQVHSIRGMNYAYLHLQAELSSLQADRLGCSNGRDAGH